MPQARDAGACVRDEVHGVRCTTPVGGRRIDGAGVQRGCGSTIVGIERRESTQMLQDMRLLPSRAAPGYHEADVVVDGVSQGALTTPPGDAAGRSRRA